MNPSPASSTSVPVWKPLLLGALAGGLGWGIRGQYGHETGAMIAGLLVSSILILLLAPDAPARPALRAAAWCTIAFGLGGSMTYGQTVGLTHDPALVGNWGALRWGLLGLSLKGALWIGFGGAFLGMGLGGKRYSTREITLLVLGLLALCAAGVATLNRPFDPTHRQLPPLYFSADWRWLPDANLKPRPEVWGAYLFAFAGLLAYLTIRRGDTLGRNLGLWGALGGALGFPLGQCLQAYHAWNRAAFQTGAWASIDPVINWWNWMETTFGTVIGATLGLGLWLNRRRIAVREEAVPPPPPGAVEALLLVGHVSLLIAVEFFPNRTIDLVYDFGLMLAFLPLVVVTAGRAAPVLFLLPITALPIAGKTLNELVYQQHALGPVAGWLAYLVLPLGVVTAGAWWIGARASRGASAGAVLAPVLLLATTLYWSLNFAFFRFPWPWTKWTVRTPNGLWFTGCAIGLVAAALAARRVWPRRGEG